MSSVSPQELVEFDYLLKEINSHLKWLLKNKPLIKREWDTEDFSQELALKYFKNIIKIAHTLKSDDHRLNLLRKMASQIANDKLKEMQRKKRDARKISHEETDFAETDSYDALDALCNQEKINKVKSSMDKDIWRVIELRSQGRSWEECADDIGYCSPSALRLKVKRNVDAIKNCV
jgi:hypothetical protein